MFALVQLKEFGEPTGASSNAHSPQDLRTVCQGGGKLLNILSTPFLHLLIRSSFPDMYAGLHIAACAFKQSWYGLPTLSVLQVKLRDPILWENTTVLFPWEVNGLVERQAREIDGDGKRKAEDPHDEQPQRVTRVFAAVLNRELKIITLELSNSE